MKSHFENLFKISLLGLIRSMQRSVRSQPHVMKDAETCTLAAGKLEQTEPVLGAHFPGSTQLAAIPRPLWGFGFRPARDLLAQKAKPPFGGPVKPVTYDRNF